MFRTRILLLMAGILISALLFLLPMIVVDNEEESIGLSTETNNQTVTALDPTQTDIPFELDSITSEKLNIVRDLFYSSDVNEKSITFADSLAILFASVEELDSVIKYREWIADNFPNEENMEAAGFANYDAFGHAIDDDKVRLYSDKIMKYFGYVFEKNPDRLDLKTKLAMTYISTRNPMQGIIMLREVVSVDPENQEALFNLGLLSRQSGQNEKAVERFESILLLNPDHLQARFLLGVTYLELGKNKLAKKQLEIVKRTDTDPAIIATVDAYLEEIN